MSNIYKIFGRPENKGDLVYSYHHKANVEVLHVEEVIKHGLIGKHKVFTTSGLTAPATGDYFTAFDPNERIIRNGDYADYFLAS